MTFDPQPTLTGPTLALRPLREGDRDALHAAASDPVTWAGHPAKTRHERAVFDPYFDFLLASGSTLVIIDRASDTIIGCSRYYTAPDRPGTVSIGFTFLDNRYWGGDTNRALKHLMVGHVLERRDAVWFHIDPTNIRSRKATAKLGARPVETLRLDLGSGEADWMVYRLSRQDRDAAQD